MSEEIENAITNLENWLSHPSELRHKPYKTKYVNKFKDEDGINCIILKYKLSEVSNTWYLGIVSDSGTFSEMEVYKQETEIDDAKKLLAILKNHWKSRAEEYERKKENNNMIPFSKRFEEQGKNEIMYNGEKITREVIFDRVGRSILKFIFLEAHSENIQCIALHSSFFKGKIYVNGKEIRNVNGNLPLLCICSDNAPMPCEHEIEVLLEAGHIVICNGIAKHLPNGQVLSQYLVDGCAMIQENRGKNRYLFYCNDVENDDDFNDLIFGMEIIMD